MAALLLSLPLTLAAAGLYAAYRYMRRTMLLGRTEFRIAPRSKHKSQVDVGVSQQTARPGDEIAVHAHVYPRGNRELTVHAALTCTMFDHRARRLYDKTLLMTPTAGKTNEYDAVLTVPEHALRSGVVGNELSKMFSEEARRLLVFWTVGFEVRPAGGKAVIARRSVPIEVPEGRALSTDVSYMNQLVVDTFAAIKDDMLLNWLVKLAAHDGEIAGSERDFLHEVLRSAHGITDAAAADARIDAELRRHLDIDATLLRKHIPEEQRVAFYKLLYAVAWRDGRMDEREHAFLIETLRNFGLDRHAVKEVELEILRGMAQSKLDA